MHDPSSAEALASSGALDAVPLFPLPGTVFFPSTLLPLHVFEQRYRQMTQDALDGHRLIAVVMIREAPEALSEVAGLGRIVHHERLPDGRFHILLQGIGRVRLLRELPAEGLPYRRARVELVADEVRSQEAVDAEVASLRACYAQLIDASTSVAETLGDLPVRVCEPSVLADLVCAAALSAPHERQAALQQPCVAARLLLATTALATLLLRHAELSDEVAH